MNNLPRLMKLLSAVTLFCGAGGGSIGVLNARFNNLIFKELMAIDNWIVAQKAFEHNFKNERHIPFWNADIFTISGLDILRRILMDVGELSLLLCSPSCQGYSSANTSKPNNHLDSRNGLLLFSIELIRQIQSKIFIVENVPGIGDLRNNSIFNEIKLRIRESLMPDYEVRLFEVDSSYFGSPQTRYRWFFIGYHKSLGVIPTPPIPDSITRERLRIVDIDPSITAIEVGQSKKTIKHNTKYMNTVTASQPVTIYSKGQKSKMTMNQDLKFASFPEWYELPKDISKKDAHTLLGNIIPPAMMQRIIEHILSEVGDKL